MRFIDVCKRRLRSLLRRSQVEEELSSELNFHLEQQVAENVAGGMRPEEARRAALRAIGNLEHFKEECRDARGVEWVIGLFRDIQHGARSLRKNPAFAAVAVLSLALGIGVNTSPCSALLML